MEIETCGSSIKASVTSGVKSGLSIEDRAERAKDVHQRFLCVLEYLYVIEVDQGGRNIPVYSDPTERLVTGREGRHLRVRPPGPRVFGIPREDR